MSYAWVPVSRHFPHAMHSCMVARPDVIVLLAYMCLTSLQQRHAATLEHGQREVRSIIGSLLLSQLKACWHNHTAQVQAEQVCFHMCFQDSVLENPTWVVALHTSTS